MDSGLAKSVKLFCNSHLRLSYNATVNHCYPPNNVFDMLEISICTNAQLEFDIQENSSKCVDGVNLKMEDIKLKFSKGTPVEVRSDEEGYKGSWYTANIVEILENDNVLVEYNTLKTDDETEFLKEETDASDIRPSPPEVQHVHPFALSERVDAWYNDGWWVGCIYKILPRSSKYKVFFALSNELLEFEHSELRPHLEWIGGKWIAALMA